MLALALLHDARPQLRRRFQGRLADRGAVEDRCGRHRPSCATSSTGWASATCRSRRSARPTDVLIRVRAAAGRRERAAGSRLKKVKDALGSRVHRSAASRWSVRPSRASCSVTGFIAVVASHARRSSLYVWFRFEWQFAVGAVAGADARRARHGRHVLAVQVRVRSLDRGGAADHARLFDERHRRRVRPHPRELAHVTSACRSNELLNLSINETLSRTMLTGHARRIAVLARSTCSAAR